MPLIVPSRSRFQLSKMHVAELEAILEAAPSSLASGPEPLDSGSSLSSLSSTPVAPHCSPESHPIESEQPCQNLPALFSNEREEAEGLDVHPQDLPAAMSTSESPSQAKNRGVETSEEVKTFSIFKVCKVFLMLQFSNDLSF